MAYLIGIDIGTSGTKTAIYAEDGRKIASHTDEYPLYQPQNGWAEQDPQDWWNAVLSGLSAVMAKSELKPDDIGGIGLSGQMHGLVMLDKNGKVLRNSIIWCDQRTAEECTEIEAAVGGRERLIEITANPALTGFTASKIMWVKKHEPEIYAQCAHILLPKDYIRFMLTGEFATEVSDASGMQLLDIPNRCWSKEVCGALGIDMDLLAKMYESPEVTGIVRAEIANAVGIGHHVPVVGGAGDNAAAAVGTGTVSEGKAFVTIGTSGVVFAHSDKVKIDAKGRVHTFCCAVPNKWHVMGVTQGAGLSLKWFRTNFAPELSYKEIDKIADSVSIGADNLLYLPYLMGERTPHLDPNARGTFVGISAIHEKKHFLRAVMEGVSYSLRDCLEVLYEMNIPVGDMLAVGGGGTSAFWRKMLCDLYNLPTKTIVAGEGACLGAAILAGVGTGVYNSVEDACDKIISYSETEAPDIDAHKEYERMYQIYRNVYTGLKPTFSSLQK
jgi:xylulokinase